MYMHIYVYFRLSVLLSHINHLIFIVKDWMQIVEGIPNATAIQLNVMDHESLFKYISQVEVVISLLPQVVTLLWQMHALRSYDGNEDD
jgi:hypothetical protein